MALSDLLKDLDPKYASALSQITEDLRREFDQKLSATRGELGLETAPPPAQEPAEEPPPPAPEPPPPASEPPPPASEPSAAADVLDPVEELKHAVVAVDGASSQGEVLDSLVSGCARFASRCAVFLVRDGQVSGWTSYGFDLSDDDMRAISFEAAADSPWQSVGAGDGTVALETAECGPICDKLGASAPEMGFLVPFVLNNQTAAGVYCDRLAGDDPPNVSALQLVTFIASQVLENLPVRDRASTSTLRLAAGAAALPASAAPDAEFSEVEAPVVTELPEVEEITDFEAPGEDVAEDLAEEAEKTTDFSAYEVEAEQVEEGAPDALFGGEPEVETGAEDGDPSGPQGFAAPAEAPPLPTEPEPPTMGFPATPTESIGDEPPPTILSDATTQVVPPSDLEGPGWAFTGAAAAAPETGDESQHEEARRLARLLVTEVKLYNEELVEQGRKKGDVYSVLKEDIDRSRQIFEDRIAEDVRAQNDYFHDALVRILAGGDPSVLGS